MTEADFAGRQIDIEELQKKTRRQAQKTAKRTKKLIGTIEEKFFSAQTKRMMGKFLLSGETRPDGSDWTMDDFSEYWDEGRREGEDSFRRNMAKDMMKGLQAQDSFFSETESPLLKASEAQTELVVAILERVLDSEEIVAYEYPVEHPKEDFWAAETLEVVRRTLIKPSYMLLEGYARSGINSIPSYNDEEFWKTRRQLITPEMEAERNSNRYWQLEQQRIDKGLQTRSEEEWIEVLKDQGIFLSDYLCLCIARTVRKMMDRASFAERLVYQGKRIYSDEAVANHKLEADEYNNLRKKLMEVQDFTEILSILREKFGPETTFRSFLESLNPRKEKSENV